MIWTNKGLKKRIAELEDEVSSLNQQVKETNYHHKQIGLLCDAQHELVKDLQAQVKSLSKTSPNFVVPPAKSAFVLGQNISKALRSKKS